MRICPAGPDSPASPPRLAGRGDGRRHGLAGRARRRPTGSEAVAPRRAQRGRAGVQLLDGRLRGGGLAHRPLRARPRLPRDDAGPAPDVPPAAPRAVAGPAHLRLGGPRPLHGEGVGGAGWPREHRPERLPGDASLRLVGGACGAPGGAGGRRLRRRPRGGPLRKLSSAASMPARPGRSTGRGGWTRAPASRTRPSRTRGRSPRAPRGDGAARLRLRCVPGRLSAEHLPLAGGGARDSFRVRWRAWTRGASRR